MVSKPEEVRMRILLCLVLFLVGSPAFSAEPLRVGVVVFEGFLSSEVVAPMEVFTKATSERSVRFEVFTVGASVKPVRSHEGLLIQPRETFANSPSLDILVVPSTMDMDRVLADQVLVAFIKERGARARYVASHCAGAFLLGKAGLLDGRRATTYIGGAESLQKMFPKARVEGDKHVVVDGNLVTSIGGAVSYEGSLALLESIAGPQTADRVADELYYFRWKEKKAAAGARCSWRARRLGCTRDTVDRTRVLVDKSTLVAIGTAIVVPIGEFSSDIRQMFHTEVY